MTLARRNKPVRIASVLSWLVLSLIAIMIAYFVWKAGLFPALFVHEDKPVPDVPAPEQITSGKSSITGFDKEQQPYRFTARSAIQDKNNEDLVHLDTVEGMFRKKDGEELELTANGGQYDSKVKILDLAGNIVLMSKGRYKAFMDKARVTLTDRKLVSKVPVKVVFDRGVIRANGVVITDNGKHVLFTGRVRTTIEPADGGTNKGNRQP